MPERLNLYATASRGTEPFLAQELSALGAKKVKQERGGLRFSANVHELVRLAIHSRIAMRLLLPLGSFEVVGAEGLYDAVKTIAWEEWLTPRHTFAVEASLSNSEHVHSGFVALKCKDAIVDRMREKCGSRPNVDTKTPDMSVVVHLSKQSLTVSLDLCGEPLFKRGYRVETGVAPLKETLAAAMLQAANYQGEEPLVDAMCGSGTIAIEAALIAQKRAPGLHRDFAFVHWPTLGANIGSLVKEGQREAAAQVRVAPHPIYARDYDADVLKAAQKNARAAQVSDTIRIEESDALRAEPPEGAAGVVLSNPPYGDRIHGGGQKGMKSFYFALGERMQQWPSWKMGFLVGNQAFESAFHRRPTRVVPMSNGPIDCNFYWYGARE